MRAAGRGDRGWDREQGGGGGGGWNLDWEEEMRREDGGGGMENGETCVALEKVLVDVDDGINNGIVAELVARLVTL